MVKVQPVLAAVAMVTWLRGAVDDDDADAPDVHRDDCCVHTGYFEGDYLGLPCDCGWPQRISAEVAVKRQILDEYERAFARYKNHAGDVATAADALALLRVLGLLTRCYADRAGYQDDWRMLQT